MGDVFSCEIDLACALPFEIRSFLLSACEEGVLGYAELESVFGVAGVVVVEVWVDFAAGFGDCFELGEECDCALG